MAEGCIIRAGDIVYHEPTGEDLVVAYVDGEHLSWCGWPSGEAKLSDCWLKKTCNDEEHINWLEQISRTEGKRGRMAKSELQRLKNEMVERVARAIDNAMSEQLDPTPGYLARAAISALRDPTILILKSGCVALDKPDAQAAITEATLHPNCSRRVEVARAKMLARWNAMINAILDPVGHVSTPEVKP